MTVKDDFIAELNPLLDASEIAINAGNITTAQWLASEILKLVNSYSNKMPREELWDALNNPRANDIAERLRIV